MTVVRALVVSMLALASLAGASSCTSGDDGAVTYEAADLQSGDEVSVEELRGQPVLLVSWATWCRECDEELSGLQEFAQSEQAEGIEIVTVNLDAADVEDEIDAKIDANGLTVTTWRDRRNDFKREFGALGVPTTVLLDADGMVAGTFPGAVDFDDDDVLAAIDEVRTAPEP